MTNTNQESADAATDIPKGSSNSQPEEVTMTSDNFRVERAYQGQMIVWDRNSNPAFVNFCLPTSFRYYAQAVFSLSVWAFLKNNLPEHLRNSSINFILRHQGFSEVNNLPRTRAVMNGTTTLSIVSDENPHFYLGPLVSPQRAPSKNQYGLDVLREISRIPMGKHYVLMSAFLHDARFFCETLSKSTGLKCAVVRVHSVNASLGDIPELPLKDALDALASGSVSVLVFPNKYWLYGWRAVDDGNSFMHHTNTLSPSELLNWNNRLRRETPPAHEQTNGDTHD